MKKILLAVALFAGVVTGVQAQSINLGINAGLPMGDANDHTNFQLGADVSYRMGVAGIFELGPMLGYSHFFQDSDEAFNLSGGDNDIQFLPIAASGRVNLTSVRAGLDLGYAVGLNDGNDGGFYYRPSLGFNLLMVGLIVSYQGISVDGVNFSSLNLGVEFGL